MLAKRIRIDDDSLARNRAPDEQLDLPLAIL
jgi:hypothetical protein